MTKQLQVQMPSGHVIWAEVSSEGPTNVGVGDAAKLAAEELRNTIEAVAESIRPALDGLAPHEVTVAFGVEIAGKSGKMVSILAECSAKANISISLTWRPESASGER